MKKRFFFVLALFTFLLGCVSVQKERPEIHEVEYDPNSDVIHEFTFGGEGGRLFLMDGKPFQIRAAEMHPQRIPREYWQHRIRVAKSMGLNTIAFYVFWNDLEQADGSWDLTTGNRDIGAFIELCGQEGMWVLFRPGPYVCGEWDFGGLPPYLLKDRNRKIRTTHDAGFMEAQERYLDVMAEVAYPYLLKNGGPILMTQLENEFGSYARKHESKYMQWLKDYWTDKGFGPFYTSDGAGDFFLKGVVLPGVAVGLDPGESDWAFEQAYRNNPGVPAFSSESYPGWLRHWGEGNWWPSNKSKALHWFMENGHSFNIFVYHGGTNFGFTAGANNSHQRGEEDSYLPDLTSYDYGAPCNENGMPTKEFFQYRRILQRYLPDVEFPEVPENIPSMEVAEFTPKYLAPVTALAQEPLAGVFEEPPYFELFDQNQGMAIYSTTIPAGGEATLEYTFFHDYGFILVDGKKVATIDRREDFRRSAKRITIPARAKEAKLEILVEAMGHINFHITMEQDRKGLYDKVTLNRVPLTNWTVTPIPLDVESVDNLVAAERTDFPGAIFEAKFNLDEVKDTFFDMSRYGKGTLYVNGVNLGRFWEIGPQYRLFCPASVLKKGENRMVIVDLLKDEPSAIRGTKERNYGMRGKTSNRDNVWVF